jgi:hypothetical protein
VKLARRHVADIATRSARPGKKNLRSLSDTTRKH